MLIRFQKINQTFGRLKIEIVEQCFFFFKHSQVSAMLMTGSGLSVSLESASVTARGNQEYDDPNRSLVNGRRETITLAQPESANLFVVARNERIFTRETADQLSTKGGWQLENVA